MNLINIYNFKNPVKHFINIDEFAFPQDIQDALAATLPFPSRLGKPEDIALFIGRRPAAAFGNSTGRVVKLEKRRREHEQGKGSPGPVGVVPH